MIICQVRCVVYLGHIHAFISLFRTNSKLMHTYIINTTLFPNWQKESWQTFEETSGYVRPERVNKWPNSMTDIWWWCLSVRTEQLGSHWTDFHEIWHLSIFRKSVEIIQVSLKSDKNNSGTLHEDRYTFYIISHPFLLRMRNISDKSCRENQNTHFVFSNFFLLKILPFMRKRGKIFVERGRPQKI